MESSPEARELLHRCARRDERALDELIARYETRVFRVAARTCGDAALAEDATVETFYKVWKSADQWNGDTSPDAWIFRIAVHTVKDLVRSRSRWWNRIRKTAKQSEIDPAPPPDAELSDAEESQRIAGQMHQLIQSFADDDRTLITLYYWEQLPLREISVILDATTAALKMRLARMRKRLAHSLELPNVD